jgi:hypothetical protein
MGRSRTEKCIAIASIELTSHISDYIKEGKYEEVMSAIFEKLKELDHGCKESK